MRTIYLAGGCFWGVQKYLDQFAGIQGTVVGYANGSTDAPSYEEVCAGSGHAETVKVVFDEDSLPLQILLEKFFDVIDPLSVNRQGNDFGIQYRTGIYYEDVSLLPEIMAFVQEKRKEIGSPLAVEVRELLHFFPAEEYHQKYLDKNPGGYCHIPAHKMKGQAI